MNWNLNAEYRLKGLEAASSSSGDLMIIQRLRDLGFYEGTPFKIINVISFNSVYVVQLEDSLVALNETEMACLKF